MERVAPVKRVILIAVLLTGCTRTVLVDKPVITHVAVAAPCPTPAERDRLKKLRPLPLRNGEMPTDPVVRNALIIAQLALYEAEGAWADQADAALDRCQQK